MNRRDASVLLLLLLCLLACGGKGKEGARPVPPVETPGNPPAIQAPEYLTENREGYTASVEERPGRTFRWTLAGARPTSPTQGGSITFQAGAAGRGTLSCKVTDPGRPALDLHVPFTVVPAPVQPVVEGPDQVTAHQTALGARVPAQAGVTYRWTIQGGAFTSRTDGEEVTFTAGGPGTLRLACSARNAADTESPEGTLSLPIADRKAPVSANEAAFDPAAGIWPLPNLLTTLLDPDPLASRAPGAPLGPREALAYVNRYEVGGSHAVSGLNAPIRLSFLQPLQRDSVKPGAVKVFEILPQPDGFEEGPLRFQDATDRFRFADDGDRHLGLHPKFPLPPGGRFVYCVTDQLLDAASGHAVAPSRAWLGVRGRAPLPPALEALRSDLKEGSRVRFAGYGRLLDDLVKESETTGLFSREEIVLLGRFATTLAGSLIPDPDHPERRLPVETALHHFAQGALREHPWSDTLTLTEQFTVEAGTTGTFWNRVTGRPPAEVPGSIGRVVLGHLPSGRLALDPVAVRREPARLSQPADAATPFSGVVQPFRDGQGRLTGFHYVPCDLPFLYLAPAQPAPADGYPVVIYQHGFGSRKEDLVAFAPGLTQRGFAILAVDLPHHGAGAHPMDFVAFGAPLAARANLLQAGFNLARLERTLAAGAFQGLGARAPAPRGAAFFGTSLGAIVGSLYLAGNATLPCTDSTLERDMRGVLNVPGSVLAYLFQESPALRTALESNPAFAALGPEARQAYVQDAQAILDAVDPASLTTPLEPGAPSRLARRLLVQEATSTAFDAARDPLDGDKVIPNRFTRYFGNALGGRALLGTPGAAATGVHFAQIRFPACPDGDPEPFLYPAEGGPPKVTNPPGQGEGYCQFFRADHGLSEPMSRQLVPFLRNGTVVDPFAPLPPD